MKIDKNKLTRFIADSQFGTGTLAKSLSIHPDVLHKVIALAEGEESLVRRIESVLKGSITENGLTEYSESEKLTEYSESEKLRESASWSKAKVEEETAELTIDETIRFILDNPGTRNTILEIEQAKEHSRISLLDLIKPREKKPKNRIRETKSERQNPSIANANSDSENRETESKRQNPSIVIPQSEQEGLS